MIDGLVIKKIKKHASEDGFFAELLKFGEETFHEIKQTSYSETLPGTIKAFHLHKAYWEMWCVIKGEAKVVVYDGRQDSPTEGQFEVIYTGESNLLVIAIPPGAAHGYQVLSSGNLGVVYHAGKAYDPKNHGIEEIPHDDPSIGFDWTRDYRA